jgi:hypothetical protein
MSRVEREKNGGQWQKKSQGLFFRDKVFADPKALLRFKQKPLEDIKSSCLVGTDANILLTPYQVDQHSLREISRVYGLLNNEKRLVIPGQALREFFTHRAEKLGRTVDQLRGEMNKLISPPLQQKIRILDDDTEFQRARAAAKNIRETSKTLCTDLTRILNRLSASVGDDPVSVAYSTLTDAVRDLTLDEKQQSEFLEDLAYRYLRALWMRIIQPAGLAIC